MLITKKFKHYIHKWYSCEDCYVYSSYGERLAILELDDCGSTLSLSVYDPHSKYGYATPSVHSANIESWNENVLTFKGFIGRIGVRVVIELDPQNGDIAKLTMHSSNDGGYHMLTNDEAILQNEIIELQNKHIREYVSSR